MKRAVAALTIGALVGMLPITPAQAAPTCGGETATIVGTRGDDRLVGTEKRDVIVGRGGYDEIFARGGDDLVCAGDDYDSVYGGAGDDRLKGQGSGDSLHGGPGNDILSGGGVNGDGFDGGPGDDIMRSPRGQSGRLYYTDSPAGVVVNLGEGTATGWGNDTLIGRFGYVSASNFDDVIIGRADGEQLSGMGGDDQISGRGGDDSIAGLGSTGIEGSDDDTLRGGAGNDEINGEKGSDTIYGGPGNDDLAADLCRDGDPCPGETPDSVFGGPGDDILDVWDFEANDTADAGDGVDTCYLDEGDTITNCEDENLQSPP